MIVKKDISAFLLHRTWKRIVSEEIKDLERSDRRQTRKSLPFERADTNTRDRPIACSHAAPGLGHGFGKALREGEALVGGLLVRRDDDQHVVRAQA